MLMVVTPTASSCMRVFPRTTPCASSSLSTSGLLLLGLKPAHVPCHTSRCFHICYPCCCSVSPGAEASGKAEGIQKPQLQAQVMGYKSAYLRERVCLLWSGTCTGIKGGVLGQTVLLK